MKRLLLLGGVLTLAGCAGADSVLFITKTSLGVDLDTKPASLSVAYDRKEGYLGPRYDNGAVPPVTASIKSDGGIFTGKVKQVYATGNAALILATDNPDGANVSETNLSGEKKLMFFGTDTTTGLKVGFTGQYPDSFVFGYKRKEFSYIPVGTTVAQGTKGAVDTYPSVLATIDTTGSAIDDKTSGLVGTQFFATGAAADALAKNKGIHATFKETATSALAAYKDASSQQQVEVGNILKCYPAVKESALPDIWSNAESLKLYYDDGSYRLLSGNAEAIRTNHANKVDLLRASHKRYTSEVSNINGTDKERQYRLLVHADYVCAKARE